MIIFPSEVQTEIWFLLNGTAGYLINTTMLLLPKAEVSTIHSSKNPMNGTIPILLSRCSLHEWQTQTKEQLTTQTIVRTDTQKNGPQQQKERNDKI